MADLIAIGYDDETTAARAAEEARRLARDLIIQPDAGWTQTDGHTLGQRAHNAGQSAHVGPPHVAVAQR